MGLSLRLPLTFFLSLVGAVAGKGDQLAVAAAVAAQEVFGNCQLLPFLRVPRIRLPLALGVAEAQERT